MPEASEPRPKQSLLASATLPAPPTVTVVITTCNDFDYLRAAVCSALRQQRPPDEVLVVDDGSTTSPAMLLADLPTVKLLRKPNGGLSSARNFGLRAARSTFITFLDADDLYEPDALATGLACFAHAPGAAMVYGGHRRVDAAGTPTGKDHFVAAGPDPHQDLLRINFIGMHATVLYRTDLLQQLGGFDESLRSCEDYDVYLRLSRKYPLASHPDIIAEYRRHSHNMSSDNARMLASVLEVHGRHHTLEPGRREAWHAGQQFWQACYKPEDPLFRDGRGPGGAVARFGRRLARSLARRLKPFRHGRVHRMLHRLAPSWPPPLGMVDFGSFTRTEPISADFGYDRGTPIDRFYIEKFLDGHHADITGRVLEAGEASYSRRFGGDRIQHQDILHYSNAGDGVTIVGDLTAPGTLPDNAFDCIILTQVLQWVFHLEAAVTRLYAALKPGGVLLLTVPGISQIEQTEYSTRWLWNFTEDALQTLFSQQFSPADLQITTCGNVYAAVASLQGLALEEVDRPKLDHPDLIFPVVVTLRARKPA